MDPQKAGLSSSILESDPHKEDQFFPFSNIIDNSIEVNCRQIRNFLRFPFDLLIAESRTDLGGGSYGHLYVIMAVFNDVIAIPYAFGYWTINNNTAWYFRDYMKIDIILCKRIQYFTSYNYNSALDDNDFNNMWNYLKYNQLRICDWACLFDTSGGAWQTGYIGGLWTNLPAYNWGSGVNWQYGGKLNFDKLMVLAKPWMEWAQEEIFEEVPEVEEIDLMQKKSEISAAVRNWLENVNSRSYSPEWFPGQFPKTPNFHMVFYQGHSFYIFDQTAVDSNLTRLVISAGFLCVVAIIDKLTKLFPMFLPARCVVSYGKWREYPPANKPKLIALWKKQYWNWSSKLAKLTDTRGTMEDSKMIIYGEHDLEQALKDAVGFTQLGGIFDLQQFVRGGV